MMQVELKARIDELEAVAEHVPPAVLGHRLLAALEDHFDESVEFINIWSRFQEVVEEPGETPLWSEEVHCRTRSALESTEALAAHRLEEIGRLKDTLREERIAREERPSPEPLFDPGIPAGAADRAAPEIPEPEERNEEIPPEPSEPPERKIPEKAKIRAFHSSDPEPAEEPSKTCKTCGETRTLGEFPKNGTYKDGHTNKCKPCTREYHRRREQESRDRLSRGRGDRPRMSVVPPATEGTEARTCANGTSCAGVDPDDLVPTPAILDAANPGPLCRRCARRAGVA